MAISLLTVVYIIFINIVNTLQRANTISTMKMFKRKFMIICVSMPFNGLLPFLLMNYITNSFSVNMCQCPSTGYYHFYEFLNGKDKQFTKSVNALQRAITISTYEWTLCANFWIHVSMPFNGLLPFLPCPSETPYLCGFREGKFPKVFRKTKKTHIFLNFLVFLFFYTFLLYLVYQIISDMSSIFIALKL